MKAAFKILSALSISCPAIAQEKPNIVFILLDDFGYHQLQSYGSTYYETPQIDRLAQEGMRFTQAYASAALSSPTRAAIMTGMYPARLHLTDWLNGNVEPSNLTLTCPAWTKDVNRNIIHLPQMMKEAGYATSLIGKWHAGSTTPGFDEILRYDGPKDSCLGDDCHRTKEYTDKAIDFITRKKDEPFFCFLSHNAIHTPESENSDLVNKYRAKQTTVEKGFLNPVQGAMIERLDNETGRLLDAITQLGLDEKTIIILFSDNGQFSPQQKQGIGSPLRGSKVTLWEGGMREPLLIRWKNKIPKGTVCNAQVIGHDFLPTIAELCNINSSRLNNIDGVSFAKNLLESPQAKPERDFLCWHYPHYHTEAQFQGAIRKGDWKLIEYFDRSIYFEENAFELYNLANDLDETDNLMSSHPEIAAELYADLVKWRQETNAQMPYNKKTLLGLSHFRIHKPNTAVKSNEFEIQKNLSQPLMFDGKGTYIHLENNSKLYYYLRVENEGEYTFSILGNNTSNSTSNIHVQFPEKELTFSFMPKSDWVSQSQKISLKSGEIVMIEIASQGEGLQFDKWVLTNNNTTLTHDGDESEIIVNTQPLMSFEAEEIPLYSSIVGNATHQQQTPIVIDNPNKSSINNTEKCLYMRSQQDVPRNIPGWAANNIVITLKEPLAINEKNRFLHIMHWKEKTLNSWVIYGSEDGVTDVELGRGTCPQAQTWFDMVVDVSSKLKTLRKIKIIADGNWSGSGESRYYAPTRFYYDEIILSENYLPRTSTSGTDKNLFRENDLFSLSPNPVVDHLRIESRLPITQLWVSKLDGTTIHRQETTHETSETMDVRNLKPGIYLVSVLLSNEKKLSQLFIKQ